MLPLLLLQSFVLAAARPVSPPHEGNCQSPKWAPDGAKLAYEVNYHDRKVIELYVYEPGKGSPRQVKPLDRGTSSLTAGFSTSGPEMVAHEASWAPPAMGRFVYSASNSSRDYDLYIEGSGAIAASPGADGGPEWSADGRWIVFTSARSGQGDLYLIDVHNIDLPPVKLTTAPESSELYASFSPDSKQLLYVSHTDSGDNIWIIDDLSSARSRKLTTWSRTQTRPRWSPDGKRIAFYANKDHTERFDLYAMSLGGQPFAVAQGVVLSHAGPTWTPDSKSLIFVKDDDKAYDPVYRVPIADPGKAHALPTGTVGNGDLDVTQGTDGQTWLAVSAQGQASDKVRDFKRIYVMLLEP